MGTASRDLAIELQRLAAVAAEVEAAASATNPLLDHVALFSMAGPLSVQESPRFYPYRNVTGLKVHVSLAVAGTATTTVQIKVKGVVKATLTLGSGVNVASGSVAGQLVADIDYLTVNILGAGLGAQGIVVQVRGVYYTSVLT